MPKLFSAPLPLTTLVFIFLLKFSDMPCCWSFLGHCTQYAILSFQAQFQILCQKILLNYFFFISVLLLWFLFISGALSSVFGILWIPFCLKMWLICYAVHLFKVYNSVYSQGHRAITPNSRTLITPKETLHSWAVTPYPQTLMICFLSGLALCTYHVNAPVVPQTGASFSIIAEWCPTV